jgi:hypothetical protein
MVTSDEFAFWGSLKGQVFTVKTRDHRHLRQTITDCCAAAHPSRMNKMGTIMVTQLWKFVNCQREHKELKCKKKKLHGLSPRANYTDRATADCRRSGCQLLRIEGATWSA